MDHAIGTSYVHRQVSDNRELHIDAEFLLDIAHPGDLAVMAVDRQAEKVGVERQKIVVATCIGKGVNNYCFNRFCVSLAVGYAA